MVLTQKAPWLAEVENILTQKLPAIIENVFYSRRNAPKINYDAHTEDPWVTETDNILSQSLPEIIEKVVSSRRNAHETTPCVQGAVFHHLVSYSSQLYKKKR